MHRQMARDLELDRRTGFDGGRKALQSGRGERDSGEEARLQGGAAQEVVAARLIG
jgi:hypothetical protein